MYEPANPESALHIKHRETARGLIANPSGELLLIKTHGDPGTGLPPRWLTPGGGIDPGETVAEAASRELWEELGLNIDAAELGEPHHNLDFRMDWANRTYETGTAYFYQITVDNEFTPNNANWTIDEHRDVLELRWWNVQQLLSSKERLGPPGLRELIQSLYPLA
jgi:8-oxo-dGTP pyrophosphatase MutT (NUDIX family)